MIKLKHLIILNNPIIIKILNIIDCYKLHAYYNEVIFYLIIIKIKYYFFLFSLQGTDC
jgi:hypothetical protein